MLSGVHFFWLRLNKYECEICLVGLTHELVMTMPMTILLAWPKSRTTSDKVITSKGGGKECYIRLCKFKAKNSALIIIIFAFVKRRGATQTTTSNQQAAC